MALRAYEEENIQAIADAIRSKNGSTDTYTVSEMGPAIEALPQDRLTQYIINRFQGYNTYQSGDTIGIVIPDGVDTLQPLGAANTDNTFPSGVNVKIWVSESVISIPISGTLVYQKAPFYNVLKSYTQSTTYHRLQIFIAHDSAPEDWSSNWSLISTSAVIPEADIHWGATYEDFLNYEFPATLTASLGDNLETMDIDPNKEVTI